ncbi:hypothetical protein F8M41_011130 [Gigaspora margarita]|uniref:Uncharacterized protein n=1 Tax=Gigaspora margarita TaxID=4874 RepID=A0A8H3X2T0_GIGMA|nr:hypothetical protein F8M41_011130 [Gigaspora margarita]
MYETRIKELKQSDKENTNLKAKVTKLRNDIEEIKKKVQIITNTQYILSAEDISSENLEQNLQDNSSKQIGLQCNETPIYNIVDNASIPDELNDIPGSNISDNIFSETKPYENKEIKFLEQLHKEHIKINTKQAKVKEIRSWYKYRNHFEKRFDDNLPKNKRNNKLSCDLASGKIYDEMLQYFSVHDQKSRTHVTESTLKSKNVGFNPISDNQNHTTKPSSSKDVSNIEVDIPTETSQVFNSKGKLSISSDSSPENDQDLKLPEVEINTSTEDTEDEDNNKESSDDDNSDDEGSFNSNDDDVVFLMMMMKVIITIFNPKSFLKATLGLLLYPYHKL